LGTALLDHFALLSCQDLPPPSSNFPSPEMLTTLSTPKVKVGKTNISQEKNISQRQKYLLTPFFIFLIILVKRLT